MSRSIHQTLRSVFKGKSVPEIDEMCDQENPDPDVAALRKKRRYKRATARGKFKTKCSPIEYTTHILVSEFEGHSVITVDDYELFDFLDDFFSEQDIVPSFTSKEVAPNGLEFHSLHFFPSCTTVNLLQLLAQIPTAEIERIHNLNKPQH